MNTELIQLIDDAIVGEKYPIAKLISKIESADNLEFRESLFSELKKKRTSKKIH